MTVYLSSPKSQMHCAALTDMPVLLSFANWHPFVSTYQTAFSRVMLDSGAFSEFNSGKMIDLTAYRDWSEPWRNRADAIAGLDDIRGDWHKSLANYAAIPWGFPTFHDSDPAELLPDLVAMAQARQTWLGIGLVPPRHGKEHFLRRTFDCIPQELHIHLFAGREYVGIERVNSTDSTDWWLTALRLRGIAELKHLTPAECLEIVIKRYKRWNRKMEMQNENL